MTERTHFPDHYALAETKWFRLEDGHRLVLEADDVGPICDVHTHLALSFGGAPRVDLRARHERTRHYLPMENALDLEVYINRNFGADDLRRMKRDLTVLGLTPWGMRATHTAERLTGEMRDLGIVASVLLPIDYPAFSYNAEAYLEIAGEYDALTSLGSVHPYGPRVEEKLDAQLAAGARGVKVHPTVQLVRPDHPKCMHLYRLCGERSLPILWHCGPVDIEPRIGRYLSQLKHYWRAVAECPETTFILGHSGALQFEAGLDLAKTYPNVWLEVSSQSLTNVRRALAEAPPERIMFGTDWPFYHQATQLVKVLMATEGDRATRHRVLWENAARLFDLRAPDGASA